MRWNSGSYTVANRFFLCITAGFIFNLLAIQIADAQSRRYVGPGGNGTGTSWNDAGNFQAMINASGPGDEVWVLKGNYQPAAATAFSMKAGVKIYGSFSGTESTLGDRVIGTAGADSSKLVGNGNSVIINSNNGLDATAILDGFFITGGFASHGGGMYNLNSSPTISHCIFSGNTAGQVSFGSEANGGGMYNRGASLTISNCVFTGNNAGINGIQGIGGAICNEGASAIITNSIFSGNNAQGNTIKMGGAIAAGGDLQIVNCVFLGNVSGRGGAIYSAPAASITSNIINCSFSGTSGDAVFFEGIGNLNIANCIIWGNSGGINNNIAQSGKAVASYSIIQGGYPGQRNLNVNPLFVSQPGIAGGTFGDLSLQPASPAIDSANPSFLPPNTTTDLAGNPRIYNTILDRGAYEFQGSRLVVLPAGNNKTATMPMAANTTATFLTDANGLIATVTGDATPTSVAGSVTAKVWLEPGVPQSNNQPYVARHYEITPTVNNATAIITLYFTQQDFTDFNNVVGTGLKLPASPADAEGYKTNLRIVKYSLTSNDGTGLMDTYSNGATVIDPDDAAIVWNGNYWSVSFSVTSFSGFFAQASQTALPVKWITSNVQQNNQSNAVINWKVWEQNVASYEIQQSGDGVNFKKAGTVNSKGDGENSYQFTDAVIIAGTVFYRILQTDKDGKISYSSILKLQANMSGRTTASIYPNPVNNTSVISINSVKSEEITLRIRNSKGVMLQQSHVQINAGYTILPLITAEYPAGLYLLEVSGQTFVKQIKLIKL